MADEERNPSLQEEKEPLLLFYLTDEDLLQTRNNSRVRRLEMYETANAMGKPFYIYYNSNKLKSKGSIPVVY
jgi:hypothetical protein